MLPRGAVCLLLMPLWLLACCALTSAEDRWVWRDARALRENRFDGVRNVAHDKYRRELYAAREREPTTRRPLPGVAQNDELDDYPDGSEASGAPGNVGTRQYPYIPGGDYGGVGGGYGGYGGFAPGQGYPGNGNGIQGSGAGSGGGFGGNPGILVGPGGPTGIIGRPPQQYPFGAGAQAGGGFGGFTGTQNGLGGIGGAYPSGFAGGYPTQGFFNGGQGGFGGQGQYPGVGQYPVSGQFPGAVSTQFGQYPDVGQYGGIGGGPQYTEGYGLAYTNGQPGLYGGGLGFPANFRYDGKRNTVAVAEGKSARVESRDLGAQKVDDKLVKAPKRN